MKRFEVAIIGAGTAGLSARKEVAKKTDSYVVIDDGPLGTTCARVGCMPSKVLIQAANDYHSRKHFETLGIFGSEKLEVSTTVTMKHVRALRDRFVRSVKSPMAGWEDKLLRGRAQFVDKNTLEVDGEKIYADTIIIAAGSRPILPEAWKPFESHLVDTNTFFELEELPKKMAIIGLGVIGIELGQALGRLGVETVGVTVGTSIGGLTDPELQSYVNDKFAQEFPLHTNGADITGVTDDGRLRVIADGKTYEVDKALVSIGRRPNLDRVGLESLGIQLNKRGLPEFDVNTMKLKEAPHIFIAGDINGDRPILHEAADEGTIAGYNAVNSEQCFKRRVPLGIVFSDPNIAFVGQRYSELEAQGVDFVTGSVSFEGQGRSIVKLKEQGLLHVYANKQTGLILGAELQAPDGEHLAHLLAWAITAKLSVKEALQMPFYHPVIEEGLRTALRNAAEQLSESSALEMSRCQDPPIR